MGDPGLGRYLFAVTRGLASDAVADAHGLRDAPVELVEQAGLQGVVCTVALGEFGEEPLRRNLEDLAWLEEVARAHNDVVFAVAARATVAPMRLVTICSDDDSVRARIQERHDELGAALDRVEGRREWSVKVYAAAEAPPAPEPPAAAVTGAGAGAAYLQRKREQAAQRRTAGERSTAMAEEIHEVLASSVVAARRLAPQDPRLTGRGEPMILNGAYLVADDEGKGFQDLVHRVAQCHRGTSVEIEGPWPPYSFATLD